MNALADLRDHIRSVTRDEVAFYEEHGWVMLPELLSAELAAEMLAAAKVALESPEGEWDGNRTSNMLVQRKVEPFRSVILSPEMGRVATALINRRRLSDVPVAVQYQADSLWAKGPGASATSYHQDEPVRPGDRAGVFNLWLALDEVTPEMGSLRYLSGVHREGPLGASTYGAGAEGDLLDYYPKLTDIYEWSPPLHYRPGDATAHHAWMVHGNEGNATDRERYGYILEFIPADTRFFFDGVTRLISGMNQRGMPLDDYPILAGTATTD